MSDDEHGAFGGGALILAVVAGLIGIGAGCAHWYDGGATWTWVALGFGAVAAFISIARVFAGRFGLPLFGSFGAFFLGACAMTSTVAPIVAPIGFGIWFLLAFGEMLVF